MKILHVYLKTDEMVAQHVTLLVEGMQHSVEVQAVSNLADFKSVYKSFEPDIVHCHGCWQYSIVNAGNFARKQGAPAGETPQDRPLAKVIRRESLCCHRLWQDGTAISAAVEVESPHRGHPQCSHHQQHYPREDVLPDLHRLSEGARFECARTNGRCHATADGPNNKDWHFRRCKMAYRSPITR